MPLESDTSSQGKLNIALVLGGIFALALFIRTYFAFDLSLGGFLVSGGSDAYYYRAIIDHITSTGHHLFTDPRLNFPVGMNNPRPPIYGWSVALTGMLTGYLQGSVELGVWQSFLFSTALWGALTIFPTYFLGRNIFGHRAGLVAAFFLAILPAHIQRTPFSNGDHDALVLFFVVTSFYFLLRALEELREKTWVEKWSSPRNIYQGVRELILEGRRAILFSIMSGTAIATVALTWQGWAYVPIVIIAYFIVQLLVYKLRNQDPLGVLLVFVVTLGTAHLLAAPYYMSTGFVRTWFDVPLILFAATVGLGVLFTVFHRLPWLLVIPPIVLGFGAGLVIASTLSPTVAGALSSGFGYFAPDKVYETIAEAQPPNLSEAILSFGAVTYYLSLFGIGWMAVQFLRRPRSDYLFALAWSAAAIFMGMLAVRFIFNASPAFALTAGWITVLLVERLGLEKIRKVVAATGASKLTAFRKGIKARHIAGGLFVALLLVLPNTWLAVDAGVPYEKKAALDQEVYNALPGPLKPADYSPGNLYYFGAFGYSLPLKTNYYPQAWDWLQQQDTDVMPVSHRPAFLSWWDYGFEAIEEGKHPAVADNFQNGYEFAGHFLLSQDENQGVAVLSIRLLDGDLAKNRGQFSDGVKAALESKGLDPSQIQDVMLRPTVYIPLIRADPERFGRWDDRLSTRNTRVIYTRTILTEQLDLDGQADLYRELREATGNSIEYFAVDSRLIPFSGTNTGIFYAPVKLTDHRTAELAGQRSIPVDFYRLIAVSAQGAEYDLDKVPPATQITNIRIEYLQMFYESMLYRMFFGQSGTDVGLPDNGLPGLSGDLSNEIPLQGWGLEHFRLVYRTAYYNPAPPEDVANHSADWTAMDFFEARELQKKIEAGEAVGTVDLSTGSNLVRGVAFLKYYDGAQVQGRVTAEDGAPLGGVTISVFDELTIPHGVTTTDSQGYYSILAPWGDVQVVASTGNFNIRAQAGSVIVGNKTLQIREDQAARESVDLDGDGLPDYIIPLNFQVSAASISGTAFLDLNRNGVLDSGEDSVPGQTVEIRTTAENILVGSDQTSSTGAFAIEGILPGSYYIILLRAGTTVLQRTVNLAAGQNSMQELGVQTGGVRGTVLDEFGQAAGSVRIEGIEEVTGLPFETLTGEDGNFSLSGLIEGNYTFVATMGDAGSLPQTVHIVSGANVSFTQELTVRPMGEVNGRTLFAFRPLPYGLIALESRKDRTGLVLRSDASGIFHSALPQGTYDVYSLHFDGGAPYAYLRTLVVEGGVTQSWEVDLEPAVLVSGILTLDNATVDGGLVTFETGGAIHEVTTDSNGSFLAYMPKGSYGIWALHEDSQFVATQTLSGAVSIQASLTPGSRVEGVIFDDKDGSGAWDPGEGVEGITLRIHDSQGRSFFVVSGENGEYGVPLLQGIQYTLSVDEPGYGQATVGPIVASNLIGDPDIRLVAEPVGVKGTLVPLGSLEVAGITVHFDALGDGAQTSIDATDASGVVTLELSPGLYAVSVDHPISGDDLRLQGLSGLTLRVPVGKPLVSFDIEVVERVRLQGEVNISSGPFTGDIGYSGTEEGVISVDGNYTAFLRPGNYTLRATSTVGGQGYVLLEVLELDMPKTLNLTLVKTSVLTGVLKVGGVAISSPVELAFTRSDGASLQVVSGSQGSFLASLGPGTYQISLDWRGLDTLDGATRFVRYTLDQEVILNPEEVNETDLSVMRSLDNATISGQVLLAGQTTGARIYLQAQNSTAVDITRDVQGSFSFSVAPGVYDLYAYREVGRSVRLQTLTVLPYVQNSVIITLESGYRVAGIVTLQGGARVGATLRFTSTAATLEWSTGSDGSYEVYLPLGEYQVEAEVTMMERGVDVDYRYSASLSLLGSTILNTELPRVDTRGVRLTWDTGQKTLVSPGESVSYTIQVENIGNLDDSYDLAADVAEWTFSFTPKRLSIPFGDGSHGEVQVTIVSPQDARVDHPALQVVAASVSDPNTRDTVSLDVDVTQYLGIDLRLAAQAPTFQNGTLDYLVEVVNNGNGVDTYTVILLNPTVLRSQGWEGTLVRGVDQGGQLVAIQVAAGEAANFTLRLESQGEVSTSKAALAAFSDSDRKVDSLLEFQVSLPSLEIPAGGVTIQGRNVHLGAEEFPVYVYVLLAAAAVVAGVLIFRRRGRRRRR